MMAWLGRDRRGHAPDRGATVLETAIVAPVIILIVFAIIQTSFVFRSASITTTSSRAGARVGAAIYGDATDQTAARQAMVDAVQVALNDLRPDATPRRVIIYQADAAGLPPSGTTAACSSECVEYLWDSSLQRFQFNAGTWPSPDNCGQVLDRLAVNVEVDHRSSTPIVRRTFSLEERTVMRLEPRSSPCASETG